MRAGTLMMGAALLTLAACGSNDQPEQAEGQAMTSNEVAEELAQVRIEPGSWEVTHRITDARAPNLPVAIFKEMVGRTTTVRNCISPEQAANPQANFLASQQNSNCTYEDFSMEGGRMRGTTNCTGGGMGDMRMKMEGQYTPESYSIDMEMVTAAAPGTNMTVEAQVTGRRVGDCEG